MKTPFIFFVFVCVSLHNSYSQNRTYPIGIYYSLEEIQEMQPRDTTKLLIKSRTESSKGSWGGNDFEPISPKIKRRARRNL